MHVSTHTHTNVCMCVYNQCICVHVYMCIHTYMSMHTFFLFSMLECIYVCTHAHTHANKTLKQTQRISNCMYLNVRATGIVWVLKGRTQICFFGMYY